MRDLLRNLAGQGKTIFISSHILSEVQQICGRVAIINLGELVKVATVEELVASHGEFTVVVEDASAVLELLRGGLAEWVEDPETSPSVQSRDPKDDYLIAAAGSARATLVTGDADLLELAGSIPVMSPRAFLESLE